VPVDGRGGTAVDPVSMWNGLSTSRAADLSSANLSNAALFDANLTDTNLVGVTWSDTTCPDGTLSGGGRCVNNLG
jgi:uncharacterized protein YjbI with pentapeptide repeats